MPPDNEIHDINEDPGWEKRWYAIERVTWAVLSLVLIAACLGLLGPGRLSRRVSAAGPMSVEYSRLLRERAATDIRVHLTPEATRSGEVRLVLVGALADDTRVTQSSPAPAGQELLEKAVRLRYAVQPGSPAQIILTQRAERPGGFWSRVILDGVAGADLDQFVLP